MRRSVNVFLVDDSALACRMVRALLGRSPDVVVVGEARSAETAIPLIARRLAPDVVVMDWSMPGMNGVEATAELRHTHPELRVVGFTSTDDQRVREAFIAAGASAVFAKDDAVALRPRIGGQCPRLQPTHRPPGPYARRAAGCHPPSV